MALGGVQIPPELEIPRPQNEDAWLAALRSLLDGGRQSPTVRIPNLGPKGKEVLTRWFREYDAAKGGRNLEKRRVLRERLLLLPEVLLEAEEVGAEQSFERIATASKPALLRRRVEVVRGVQASYPPPSSLMEICAQLQVFQSVCSGWTEGLLKAGVLALPYPSLDAPFWPFLDTALLPDREDGFLKVLARSVPNPSASRDVLALVGLHVDPPDELRVQLPFLRDCLSGLRIEMLNHFLDLFTESDPEKRLRLLVVEATTVVKRFGKKLSFEDYNAIRSLEGKHGLRGGVHALLGLAAVCFEAFWKLRPTRSPDVSWEGESYLTLSPDAGADPAIDTYGQWIARVRDRQAALLRIVDHQAKIAFRKTITITCTVIPARETLIRERVGALVSLLTASIENPRLKKTIRESLSDPNLVPDRTSAQALLLHAEKGKPRLRIGTSEACLTAIQLDHVLRLFLRPHSTDDELQISRKGGGLLRKGNGEAANAAVTVASLRAMMERLGAALPHRGIKVSAEGGYELSFESEAVSIDVESLARLKLPKWTRQTLDRVRLVLEENSAEE